MLVYQRVDRTSVLFQHAIAARSPGYYDPHMQTKPVQQARKEGIVITICMELIDDRPSEN